MSIMSSPSVAESDKDTRIIKGQSSHTKTARMSTMAGRDEVEIEWAEFLANLESYKRQTTFQTLSNSLGPPCRTQSIQSAREDAQAHQQSARIELIGTSKASAATDNHKAKYVEKHTRPDGRLLPSAFANDFEPKAARRPRRVRKTGYTRVSPWARQAMETRRLLSLQRRCQEEVEDGPPTDITQQPRRSYPGDVRNAVARERSLGVVGAHWTSPVQHLSGVVSPMGASRQQVPAGDASPATMGPGGTSVGRVAGREEGAGTMAADVDEEDVVVVREPPRLFQEVYYADRPFTLCTVVDETRAVNQLVWRLFEIPIFGWTPRHPVMSAVPRPGQFQQGPGEVYVSRGVSYYGGDVETPHGDTDLAAFECGDTPGEAQMSRLRLMRSEPLRDWPRRSAIDDYNEDDDDSDEDS
ncbi:hypothetical protein LTS17_000097 [Exophiala oligosperma]